MKNDKYKENTDIIDNDIDNNNKFINILYGKPTGKYEKNKIKLYFKQKEYYKKAFYPVYKELLEESPDIETLCEFADFIRLLEKVFFYNNDIKIKSNERDYIYSDSNINSIDKNLILILKDNIMIKFNMKPKDNKLTINIDYQFGKRAKMTFIIVDRYVEYSSYHEENLMITVLERLQSTMSELFKEYYFKV